MPAATALAGPASLSDVIVSEIMYHPPDVGAVVGDEFEFIELKNTGSDPVDLSGVAFADGITYVFPSGSSIEAGGFVLLAANAAQFAARYGFQADGQYTGALNNAGERVALAAPNGAIFFQVTYSDDPPWPGAADGDGFSLVQIDPNGAENPDRPDAWRASSEMWGSPGADDPQVDIPPVFVNELLAHTDPPQQDAVELFNPNDETVNIGGWYLTDNANTPTKYRFPSGTTIPPGGYLIVDEEDFNSGQGGNIAFGFSSTGEEVYLYSADQEGNLTGYRHGYEFAASENQVSFGRYVNSIGIESFVRQRANTFGQENAGPRPSPIVISEIMYHPLDGSDEFLEIANISNGLIPLYDPLNPANTWLVDGIMWVFPEGVTLQANEVLLLVPIEPEAFRSRYGIPPSVQIYGPYLGQLSNSGERLVLQKPDPPNNDGEVPYIDMDAVAYGDSPPWPTQADGGGRSLQRTDLEVYADDPIYWQASPVVGGTPGDLSSTAVEPPGGGELARGFLLEDAYPNPFNPVTQMTLRVAATQEVRAELCDVVGRTIRPLFFGTVLAGTDQTIRVEASGLPSGTYFVRVQGAEFVTSKPIVLVK